MPNKPSPLTIFGPSTFFFEVPIILYLSGLLSFRSSGTFISTAFEAILP